MIFNQTYLGWRETPLVKDFHHGWSKIWYLGGDFPSTDMPLEVKEGWQGRDKILALPSNDGKHPKNGRLRLIFGKFTVPPTVGLNIF